MAVVLDVSAALGWIFVDERDDLASSMAQAVLLKGAIVPPLWQLELRNALLAAERRRRITPSQTLSILSDIALLPIDTEAESSSEGELELEIARSQKLSVYDAAYLALSTRKQFLLMTRDAKLAAAAAQLGLLWH